MTGKRILVIEDQLEGREVIRLLLETWGHQVQEAASAADALPMALAFRPEVVLLDLSLGGAPDCDVIRQLRAALGSAARLVVYSGYHHLETSAREAGCDHFIVKPGLEGLETLLGAPRERRPPGVAGPGGAGGRNRSGTGGA